MIPIPQARVHTIHGVPFRPHAKNFIDESSTNEGNVAKVEGDLLE